MSTMYRAAHRRRLRLGRSLSAVLVAVALSATACGSDDDGGDAADTDPPADTETPPNSETPSDSETPPDTEAPADSETPPDSEAPADSGASAGSADGAGSDTGASAIFSDLGPPEGDPLKVALVNTEGAPGLDFPDIRINVGATFDYLNEHGGYGGRPLELVDCPANGSPESSQACAQEVVGQDVELVLIGLDLFPDYATYSAAGVPVIGMLPILPGDFSADALFLTGGNATTMGAIAAVIDQHFGAESVGIIGADNAGANASEAALTASLDIAGIAHETVKGGDNETDAGYQGLMRQAAASDPDVLVSLYADAGCIGTIRGRASLGIDIPALTTSICAETAVLDEVGDDAVGWTFAGIQTDEDTPEQEILRDILSPALGIAPEEVDPNALGLGGLGLIMAMSLATYANAVADGGGDVTGASLYDYLATAEGLELWPSGSLVDCGAADAYPSICSFTFPFAEYQEGGDVVTVPGLEAVSSMDYLP